VYLQLLFLRMVQLLLALIKVMITMYMFSMLQMVLYYILIKLVLMLFLIAVFPKYQEITLYILQVSNIILYGIGKTLMIKKVYSEIKNAQVSLVVLLMIKVILLREVLTLRFMYGTEII
jgi:hypothetical protein